MDGWMGDGWMGDVRLSYGLRDTWCDRMMKNLVNKDNELECIQNFTVGWNDTE